MWKKPGNGSQETTQTAQITQTTPFLTDRVGGQCAANCRDDPTRASFCLLNLRFRCLSFASFFFFSAGNATSVKQLPYWSFVYRPSFMVHRFLSRLCVFGERNLLQMSEGDLFCLFACCLPFAKGLRIRTFRKRQRTLESRENHWTLDKVRHGRLGDSLGRSLAGTGPGRQV